MGKSILFIKKTKWKVSRGERNMICSKNLREKEREILRNWLTWLWQLGSPNLQVDLQAGDPGKSWCCNSSPKAVWSQDSFVLGGLQSFSFKTFNWLDEAHPLLGGQSALLEVYWLLCQSLLINTFTVTSRLTFDQMSRYHDLAKLTFKSNHHK